MDEDFMKIRMNKDKGTPWRVVGYRWVVGQRRIVVMKTKEKEPFDWRVLYLPYITFSEVKIYFLTF